MNIEGNAFGNMIISSNLLASTGTVSSNNYYGLVGSYLTTTAPLTIVFSDTVDWWLSETTIAELGISLLSYASTFELATETADAGSAIIGSDGSSTSQDCAGAWGGTSEEDECGVCDGDNSSCTDCAGVINGTNWESDCGCVAADNSGDDCDDCAGVPNGTAFLDCNGTCADGSYLSWVGDGYCDASGYSDNSVGYGLNFLCEEFGMDSGDCDSYQDCAGTYFGSLVEDCSGECGGTLTLDYCGVCGGDNVANECEEPVCGDDEFDCLGDGTECIPASWECDIYWADCSNGADEANCGGDDSSSGDCVNDDSTTDSWGDSCSSWYDANEGPGSAGCLGAYDTADFTASEQCCACQDTRSFVKLLIAQTLILNMYLRR